MKELLVAIVGAIVGLATVWKVFAETLTWSHKRSKEDFDFAEKFFGSIDDGCQTPVYLIEKGLFAATGNTGLTAVELSLLLQLQAPIESIRLFEAGKKYLTIRQERSQTLIEFKKKYSSRWRQIVSTCWYLIGYVFFMLFSLSPLLFWERMVKGFQASNYSIIVLFPLSFVAAIMCLNFYFNLGFAQKLVRSYAINRSDKLSAKLLKILIPGSTD